uniref:BSD domain-containing protein n=1 Tax=Macrostomum lignano TaxID=282301 RepID=A0A1I8F9D3_9PLAT
MRRVTSRPDMPCAVVLNSLLSCQLPVGQTDSGQPFTTSTCFIVTHQAFELWFKQVIFEIDSTSWTSGGPLEPASGFQKVSNSAYSKNKLGVREDLRVKYNQQHYRRVFSDDEQPAGPGGEQCSAVSADLVAALARADSRPESNRGLRDFQFWEEYKMAVERMLHEEYLLPLRSRETDPSLKQLKMADYKKQLDAFHSIDNLEPFHLLTLLMDTDALLTKWR